MIRSMALWQAVKGHLASMKGIPRPSRSVSLRLSIRSETVVAPVLERLSSDLRAL